MSDDAKPEKEQDLAYHTMSSQDSTGSAPVVEVEFRTTDSSYPLTELSERADCRIVLQQFMPGRESGYYSYYQITGGSPDRIAEILGEYDGLDASLVNASGESGLFEVRINDDDRYFAPLLTEAGALLSEMWTVDGESHILVQVPENTSVSAVIELVTENHPTVEAVAKRQRTYPVPLLTKELFQEAVENDLTDRQREVLFAAYHGGYFEYPRQTSGEDIAADLGISPPTFSEHLRAAERKILTMLF